MFTSDDYFSLTNSHLLNESVNVIDEEVNYILNLTEEEILDLIEKKDIPQEVALKVADVLKNAPKFSRRGQLAQKLRLYAVERNKKRLEKIHQNKEKEMQEAWYSGRGQYRTTTSGRKVRWDEDDATDDAVSDMMQRRRAEAAKKAAKERLKAKGAVPKKGGKDMFESIVEYLFVEGYADTIESAELMAESISEEWANKILEANNIQPPQEKLKTDRNMFSIPQKERDAARQRLLAKVKEKRENKGIE